MRGVVFSYSTIRAARAPFRRNSARPSGPIIFWLRHLSQDVLSLNAPLTRDAAASNFTNPERSCDGPVPCLAPGLEMADVVMKVNMNIQESSAFWLHPKAARSGAGFCRERICVAVRKFRPAFG